MVEQVSEPKAFPLKGSFNQVTTDLSTRRKTEKADMLSMETRNRLQEYFLIDTYWILAWSTFINGGIVPGPIRNRSLLDKLTSLAKDHLAVGKDYRALNRKQWEYLLQIYGGDVEICCSDPRNPAIKFNILNTYFTKSNRRTCSDVVTSSRSSGTPLLKEKPLFNIPVIPVQFPEEEIMPETPRFLANFNIEKIRELKRQSIDNGQPSSGSSKESASSQICSAELHQPTNNLDITIDSKDTKEESKSADSIITTSSTDTSTKVTKTGLVGLINRGNFCYLNASLQCLFCLNTFTEYLLKETLKDRRPTPYCSALSAIAHQIFNQACSIADPIPLVHLCATYFQASKQHDMPEFIRYLLEKIDQELGEGNRITRYFTGYITSLLLCEECKFSSIKKEKFYDLQLSLAKTLPKSFGHFTSPEKLSGDFKCPRCNRRGSIIKTINITECPKYLIVQLKRFIQSPYPRKLSSYCRFRRKMGLSK
jgi:hypothetical protein